VAQFDHVGDVSPALLVQLAPKERVLVQVDSVRYRDPGVAVDRAKYTFPNPTGRFPRTLWHYFETLDGPGTATVSTGTVGEIRIGQLAAGESTFLHGAALIAHEGTMGFDLVTLATYQMPRAVVQSYLLATRLTGPGRFAFQMHGNALTFTLKPGEVIRTVPASLLMVSPGMPIRVQVVGGAPHFPPMHYFPLVDIAGPGTALVHSGRVFYEPGGE
jgi:uncharacterized protein (AIM24 family)